MVQSTSRASLYKKLIETRAAFGCCNCSTAVKHHIASFLVLVATTLAADARAILWHTFRQLDKESDIIVVATPLSTKDTAEQTRIPHVSPDIPVVGLSSEFAVSLVLKGDKGLKKLVVHHYRLANPSQWGNEFHWLAAFDPKEPTRYLLFLHREPDGRYAPLDQVDPALTSILALKGTEWDKMKLDDFKDWLDAMRWLNLRPNYGSALSPEIPAWGRGEGSLHEAALNGNLDKAKALIKANPSLVFSQASGVGQTPLHWAAEFGHKDVAELLLTNKAEIEAKDYNGWTPLFQAVFGGQKELVELLVANHANVNVKDNYGRTPLQVALDNGYTDIAALLLAHKAEVNVKNRDGITPLHYAASGGYKKLVELLLANHAEINAKDIIAMAALNRRDGSTAWNSFATRSGCG